MNVTDEMLHAGRLAAVIAYGDLDCDALPLSVIHTMVDAALTAALSQRGEDSTPPPVDRSEGLSPNWKTDNAELERALDAFWNAAYQQGQEQRGHDDKDGTAQKADDDLRRIIAGLGTSPSVGLRGYPQELTDDLRDILSMMMWNTGPIAHALRYGGQDIKRKAEEEQAEVLHWLIGLALEHGSEWRAKASDRIREIQAAVKAAASEGSTDG